MHSLVVAVAGTIVLQIQEKNFQIDYVGVVYRKQMAPILDTFIVDT